MPCSCGQAAGAGCVDPSAAALWHDGGAQAAGGPGQAAAAVQGAGGRAGAQAAGGGGSADSRQAEAAAGGPDEPAEAREVAADGRAAGPGAAGAHLRFLREFRITHGLSRISIAWHCFNWYLKS